MERVYGKDAKEASYSSKAKKEKEAEKERDRRHDEKMEMMAQVFRANSQSVDPMLAKPGASEDAAWCRNLIRQLQRMDEDVKVEFQDYVDGQALEAARGTWIVPPRN